MSRQPYCTADQLPDLGHHMSPSLPPVPVHNLLFQLISQHQAKVYRQWVRSAHVARLLSDCHVELHDLPCFVDTFFQVNDSDIWVLCDSISMMRSLLPLWNPRHSTTHQT